MLRVSLNQEVTRRSGWLGILDVRRDDLRVDLQADLGADLRVDLGAGLGAGPRVGLSLIAVA